MRPTCAVSATPLWAPWDARQFRAELPLLLKEAWPSNRNGGERFQAGSRTIAPAVAGVRPPICKRRCPLNLLRHPHTNLQARGRKWPRRRLPNSLKARAHFATSDSKYRSPRWRPLHLQAMLPGRLPHSLGPVCRMRRCMPWLRSPSGAGPRSWTQG
jgi:hypothetical protein